MAMQRLNNFEAALSFLKGELSEGLTLANVVLNRTDFSGGKIFAWMPSSTDQNAITDFRRSLRLSGDEEEDFCRFVKSFIRDPHCAVILQDTENRNVNGYRYEPFATKYNQESYWYIIGADLSEQDIRELTGEPILPYPWCGFFYTNAPVLNNGTLGVADLQEIVKTLVGVAVGAFDHESYVLWWSNSRALPE